MGANSRSHNNTKVVASEKAFSKEVGIGTLKGRAENMSSKKKWKRSTRQVGLGEMEDITTINTGKKRVQRMKLMMI